MTKFALIKVLAFIFVVGVSGVTRAQEADARPDKEIVAEQYLLAGTATRGCGELQVAVNPLNPNQIAVSAMCQLHQQEGKFEHNELEFAAQLGVKLTF